MKSLTYLVLSTIAVTLLTASASASLSVTPLGPNLVTTGNQTSQAQINVAIAPFLGSAVELYKLNVGDANDSGALAASYSTVYSNTASDPSNFVTTYLSGPSLGDPSYLLVKDGNQTPAWYLFDISAWDGTSVLDGSGFWTGNGAISHIALYGSIAAVPEATTLLVWSTLALAGAFGAKKWRKVA